MSEVRVDLPKPETGSVHAFFLGAGVPTTDPASVAIDVTDTSDYIAACFTVTAAKDTKVHDTTTFDSGATTAPSATLTITKDSFVAGGLYSGLAAPGATEVAGTVEVVTGDLGADNGEISRGTTIKTTDFAYGWTQASDDGAVLAVAISESDDASGTGAISVPSATTAGTGELVLTATGAIVGQAPTVVGAGAEILTGTGAVTVGAPTVAGSGAEVLTATGVVTVPAAIVAGVGELIFTATGAIGVPAVLAVGSGALVLTGSGAIAVPVATIVGVGDHSAGAQPVTGTGAIAAPAATVAGSGTGGDAAEDVHHAGPFARGLAAVVAHAPPPTPSRRAGRGPTYRPWVKRMYPPPDDEPVEDDDWLLLLL